MTTTPKQPPQEAKKSPKLPEKKSQPPVRRVGKPINPFVEKNPNRKLGFE